MLRPQFVEFFETAIGELSKAEGVTKRELMGLSRQLLIALHGIDDALLEGDIQFINRTLAVLTPMNKQTAVLFFQEFTGFHFDEKLCEFTKKSQKGAPIARGAAIAFLADPNQNIWTWADRNVKVEAKPFDLGKVTKFVESALKKADKEGITQEDVLRAVFKGGFTAASILVLLDEIKGEAPNAEQA